MKKFLCISGITTALLLTLLLTGWADTDDAVKQALHKGNEHYASAMYEDALGYYETGIEASPENGALNFNAAQAAYFYGDYEKAAQYYEKAEDCADKYLNFGNIFYRAGNVLEDVEQKAQCYAQALQIYKDGIMKYPQNVPLKYNYEIVKALVDELLEEMEQESGGESESQSQSEGEGAEGESQGSEDAESAQGDQGQSSEDEENAGGAQNEGEEVDDEAYSQGEEEYETDQEAIERILAMLESQEEESLKNNQGVAPGRDETNGW